ncbi:hypothetical protein H257_16301 [Aphanomyces astaci]|uniref:Uncharacterized protein n=1 Tax=Aphanomyces astaci TaxID=112090 RepID=W4FJD5_APHAT|nr:hypothetical protein H257_16301 [Aphanomyces astaci]ETV67575.1 hypothetical protein H257_16301 [Aphanomyces astaci]|eukprot:XP_009842979.1 hypothetical protein H257_16301 [Aphanomyces astaci]
MIYVCLCHVLWFLGVILSFERLLCFLTFCSFTNPRNWPSAVYVFLPPSSFILNASKNANAHACISVSLAIDMKNRRDGVVIAKHHVVGGSLDILVGTISSESLVQLDRSRHPFIGPCSCWK